MKPSSDTHTPALTRLRAYGRALRAAVGTMFKELHATWKWHRTWTRAFSRHTTRRGNRAARRWAELQARLHWAAYRELNQARSEFPQHTWWHRRICDLQLWCESQAQRQRARVFNLGLDGIRLEFRRSTLAIDRVAAEFGSLGIVTEELGQVMELWDELEQSRESDRDYFRLRRNWPGMQRPLVVGMDLGCEPSQSVRYVVGS